jgi:hypothetical protein
MITFPYMGVAALAECTGNPHGAAGVKNKKLFERKARVIFCLARQPYAGRTRRCSRKKAFLVSFVALDKRNARN